MNPIPLKIRNFLSKDPEMKRCLINDQDCQGRVEWDHLFEYAGRQINEWWAIAPLCWFHHRGGGRTSDIKDIAIRWCLERAQDLVLKYKKKILQSL